MCVISKLLIKQRVKDIRGPKDVIHTWPLSKSQKEGEKKSDWQLVNAKQTQLDDNIYTSFLQLSSA